MVKRIKLKSVADDQRAARRAERAFQNEQKQYQAEQEARLTNLAAGLGLTRDNAMARVKSDASVRLAAAKSAQLSLHDSLPISANLGLGTDNLSSAGTFGFNP